VEIATDPGKGFAYMASTYIFTLPATRYFINLSRLPGPERVLGSRR
jgi:hypothetical protein